ncbi:Zn-finger nucleic acid-binding protein [Paenibacillus harenae]|uniref:Zn-finger nucleic acid-binding protein n=1 Tax=Paenibacillus harenae TaxID=306543 RepID=A0ABT9TZD5_PAEHA|nr:Zn-finger nucleic acid-binding protein [Paenibacillus harenae]
MKCPVCNDVRMREVVKDDVLIDVCPDCKGVWLDRGELDKLMQGVKEMKQEVERLEQYSAGAGAFGGPAATPAQPASGPAPGSWAANNNNQPVNNSQPQGQGTPSFPQVSSGGPFVQPNQQGQPIPPQQQGGFGQQGFGNPGNPQVTPMNNYGGSQPQVFGGGHQPPYGQQGYNNNSHNHGGYDKHGYDKYGYDKHGYNKYGHSHKRKKTVLDVFGDLFD